LFIGLLKNADFTMNALMALAPNVLKLLPYTVMTMIEDLKGGATHKYRDTLGEIVKQDFSTLEASLSFTRLDVKNIYDTSAGFLDNISIAYRANGREVRQGFRIKETMAWTVDAGSDIKDRLHSVEHKILAAKANLLNSDAAKKIAALEKKQSELLSTAAEKGVRRENRDKEMDQLRTIVSELRRLRNDIEQGFEQYRKDTPLFDPLPFKVLEAEKRSLQKDLDYLESGYFEDKEQLGKRGRIKRFKARKRIQAFEAKYKRFDVNFALRGISLNGGEYVRDLINNTLRSLGFIKPKLKGVENTQIKALNSAFTASGSGVSRLGDESGLAIEKLHLPLIDASSLLFDKQGVRLDAGAPMLKHVFVSVKMDLPRNPLDKEPDSSFKWVLSKLDVGKAVFNGLTIQTDGAEPLVNFPKEVPVEIWRLRVEDYDPDQGDLNLRIGDIRVQGVYSHQQEDKKITGKVGFGLDTTLDNDTKEGRRSALILHYDKSEQNIVTKLNIPSAWVPSIHLKSDSFSIDSLDKTNAIELTNLSANLKVKLARSEEQADETQSEKAGDQARPTSIEIDRLEISKIAARGMVLRLYETLTEENSEKTKKKSGKKVQEVHLPESDQVFIHNIEVRGLRVTLANEGVKLSTLEDDALLKLGEGELGGIGYKEKSARGSLLRTISLHKGHFDEITFEALGRNDRKYSIKEFFQFFGYTRFVGLDAEGSYKEGKTSGRLSFKGKKNLPISLEFIKPEEGEPAYYKIRLPLERITVPALDMEKQGHRVTLPKGGNKSYLRDVDIKLRAYVELGEENTKARYDVYLDSLAIAEMNVFGLQYRNTTKGIEVLFDASTPLRIPNVRAGGFRFSSQMGFNVFGKAGGWIEAAKGEEELISGSFEKIEAALESGAFLAEKDSVSGRSALDFDIASLGFKYDKHGNMFVHLGEISGDFPEMTITRTDPESGAKLTTTLSGIHHRPLKAAGVDIGIGVDGATDIDVSGLEAGGLNVEHIETLGKEKSKTNVHLGRSAIGAAGVKVKLKPDSSKEITITDIRAGKIYVDKLSTGAKGKSEQSITLPDPERIRVESVKILINADGEKQITVQKPTVKDVNLRIPGEKTGDYIRITCDLIVDGDVELGEGNFATLAFEDPRDAFLINVEEGVAVKINNLRLAYKDTTKAVASGESESKPLSPDQERLLELEKAKDDALERYYQTPTYTGKPEMGIENPELVTVYKAYLEVKKKYDAQKSKIVSAAKAQAQASMTKKYLDAVQGQVKGVLKAFKSTIPVNIVTHTDGEKYVEISDTLVASLKSLIASIIGSTVDMAFWESKEMKAIGKGLQRWYTWATPSTRGLIDAIADGNAIGAVLVFLEKTDISAGKLRDDPTMFGLNFNINTSYGLDLSGYDKFSIGLCEQRYKHPDKANFYNIYGLIEYLQYVSPALVTLSGMDDAKRMERLKKGATLSESQVSELGIGEAVMELIAFIKFNLGREVDNLKRKIKANIQGLSLTADLKLRPQQVISELLKEKRKGSLSLDKGSTGIDDLHLEASYKNAKAPTASANIGGGPKGEDPIEIPGGTYSSQDKGAKVSYDAIKVSPLSLTYKDDIYKLTNKNISLHGLRVGIKKK
jgi:hypothetical protein